MMIQDNQKKIKRHPVSRLHACRVSVCPAGDSSSTKLTPKQPRPAPRKRKQPRKPADPLIPLTHQVAHELGETGFLPFCQIYRLCKLLGKDAVETLVTQSREIEKKGGLLVGDGSRRRTLGGVFFWLAKKRHNLTSNLHPRKAKPVPTTRPALLKPVDELFADLAKKQGLRRRF